MSAITISDVKEAIAAHYAIDVAALTRDGRQVEAVQKRALAYKLCVDLTGATRAEIGRNFGDRDHATVVNGLSYFDNKPTREMLATYHRLSDQLMESAPHQRELVWAFPFKSRRTVPGPAPQFIRRCQT